MHFFLSFCTRCALIYCHGIIPLINGFLCQIVGSNVQQSNQAGTDPQAADLTRDRAVITFLPCPVTTSA